MLYAVCDKCKNESDRSLSPNDFTNNSWPGEGGITLTITVNQAHNMSRNVMLCPSCVTGMGIPDPLPSQRESKEELLSKFVEFVIEEGTDAICDIANDVYESNNGY